VNFFDQQQLARRNTRVMVVLYVLAVLGVVVAVDAVLAVAYLWAQSDNMLAARRAPLTLAAVPPTLLVWGALATAGVIFAVSLFHTLRLGGGGDAVAQMVGARPVAVETHDPLEQRYLNVVEEMAIAAGVRVPKAYVMDQESGINAFAAGYEVSNAVVAVTRGTLETLTRDELQGVIGHEFSHILNGDMRLNVRMLGILQGIVFIGAIGQFLLRAVGRGSGRKDGAAPLLVAGVGLFAIGAVGLVFARLIKAAVARQREFLADASSVQFTRNPEGIAGALDQIRVAAAGAHIDSRRAEELSHMFFGPSVKVWLSSVFATHPPLDQRIARVDPRFDAESYRRSRMTAARLAPAAPAEAEAKDDARRGQAARWAMTQAVLTGLPAGRRLGDLSASWKRSAGESAALVGTLDADKVDFAARMIAALPEWLRAQAHERAGAAALLIALMLAPDDAVRDAQLGALRTLGENALADAAQATERRLAAERAPIAAAFGLPVLDLALPALKQGSADERGRLLAALEAVIHADRRVTLHEFVVLTLLRHQLEDKGAPTKIRYRSLEPLRAEVSVLLWLLCLAGRPAGADPQAELERAYRAGLREMGLEESAPPRATTPSLEAAQQGLDRLRALAPLAKARLVKGLFAAASHDGTLRVAEVELLRLTGAVLDCPLPPLVTELDPATIEA
jgi:Zn-dependent protease with chaperone function